MIWIRIISSFVPNQRRDPFTFTSAADGRLFGIVIIVPVPPLFLLLSFGVGGDDGESKNVVRDGHNQTPQTTTINGRTGRATVSIRIRNANLKTIIDYIPVLGTLYEGFNSGQSLICHNGTCIVFHEIVQIFTLRIQLCLELLRVIPTLCQ